MGEFTFLLNNYSIEQIILILIVVLLCCKVLIEIFNYFYDKARNYFGVKNTQQSWEDKVAKELEVLNNQMQEVQVRQQQQQHKLTRVEEKIDKIETYSQENYNNYIQLENSMKLVQERLQENTRSFLIDAHHKFCYEVKGIDDLNLQSLERRYLYYKSAGGNSFVDELMKEIRELPKINYLTVHPKINDEGDTND